MKRAFLVLLFLLIPLLFRPTGVSAAASCRPLPTTGPDAGRCAINEVYCEVCCPDQAACQEYTRQQQTSTAANRLASVCDFIKDSGQKSSCEDCFKTKKGSWTAIGCIPTTPTEFIAKFLGLGIGLAGGIAFLLILFGGFQILTSAGNPEQLNAGRELVTSAVAGLLLIIFSLFLLRLIGYQILGIPGFG